MYCTCMYFNRISTESTMLKHEYSIICLFPILQFITDSFGPNYFPLYCNVKNTCIPDLLHSEFRPSFEVPID